MGSVAPAASGAGDAGGVGSGRTPRQSEVGGVATDSIRELLFEETSEPSPHPNRLPTTRADVDRCIPRPKNSVVGVLKLVTSNCWHRYTGSHW